MHPAAAIATTRPGASALRPAYNATAPLTALRSSLYSQLISTTNTLLPDLSVWIPLVLSSSPYATCLIM